MKMKEKIEKYKKPLLFGMIGIFLLLVVVIIIIVLMNVLKRYSYAEIESKMVDGTSKYLSQHKELYPSETSPTITIATNTLVEEKILKDITKLSKDTNCSGEVMVTFNEGSYRITPTLTCDHYQTTTLKENILNTNSIVTSEDGLYSLNDYYTYRGEFVNNYITFAGYLWRIVKFNDSAFTLVLADTVNNKITYAFDDRYNETAQSNRGRNSFLNSRIADSLQEIYQNDFKNYYAYLLEMDACISQRNEEETDTTGDVECFETTPAIVTLLPVYDFMNASLDSLCNTTTSRNCSNYNYLSNTKNRYWLLNGTDEDTYHVYFADTTGKINLDYASAKKSLRPVLSIPNDVVYKKGNGTSESPYEIYTY